MAENPIIRPPHRVTLRLTGNTMSFAIVDEQAINGLVYEPYVVKSGMSTAANLRGDFSVHKCLSTRR